MATKRVEIALVIDSSGQYYAIEIGDNDEGDQFSELWAGDLNPPVNEYILSAEVEIPGTTEIDAEVTERTINKE